jgi:hypothetical protein
LPTKPPYIQVIIINMATPRPIWGAAPVLVPQNCKSDRLVSACLEPTCWTPVNHSNLCISLLWLGTTIYYTRQRGKTVTPAMAQLPPQTTAYTTPSTTTPHPPPPTPPGPTVPPVAHPKRRPPPPSVGGDTIYEATIAGSVISPGDMSWPTNYPGDTIYPASPVATMATPHTHSSGRPSHGDRLFDD